ncbi:hypothetical protein PHLGIDRAFT_479103 [Phlebiopsis gigantea 11061_1 CR5-6]|uniref:Blue (type 1) copper domain-containing protein n=1 Tax=Phlebiopsis gigantea (strain 11061_1 CR5-6) TaxID=745531 RepID=A0A0C3NLU2_PHLG1|nr:hypothetical protein PHLGIDRAFT_479103 [Phlebiopsis gigantea 11061_1 CR5-6]
MLNKLIFALSMVPLVLSQGYGPAPGTTPASSSSSSSAAASTSGAASAKQILVQVGASGLSYSPSDIQAPVGTLVTFVFSNSVPHSVTQSSFSDPCTPLSSNGFDSGITTGTTFSVNVTDASTPVYFFCQFPAHCGSGMVGTINAPASGNGSNSAFVSAAKALGPGATLVSDKGAATGGVGAVATAGPTSGTPSVSGGASATSGKSSSSGSASPSQTSGTSGAGQVGVAGSVGLLSVVAALFAAL